jgi:hypothetical protein
MNKTAIAGIVIGSTFGIFIISFVTWAIIEANKIKPNGI